MSDAKAFLDAWLEDKPLHKPVSSLVIHVDALAQLLAQFAVHQTARTARAEALVGRARLAGIADAVKYLREVLKVNHPHLAEAYEHAAYNIELYADRLQIEFPAAARLAEEQRALGALFLKCKEQIASGHDQFGDLEEVVAAVERARGGGQG